MVELLRVYVGESPVMVDVRGCAEVEGLHCSTYFPLLCDEGLDGLVWDDFVTCAVKVKLWTMGRVC